MRWVQGAAPPALASSPRQRVKPWTLPVQLSQKNCLVKNLKRFQKQLEREAGKFETTKCAFILKTFKMLSEYHLFVEEFCKNPGITWFMKPQVCQGGWDRRICLTLQVRPIGKGTLVRSEWEVGRSHGEGIFLF
ncbi:probable alpha-tubulin polyglutamylase Ttll1 [Haliaeetus albicilla]|uniref:probable alpha-tubulin polyglutamylase Ttll1 n=1 Tax=Haliaeetus albicilla TaxID=8969 RepID=UPI0037E8F4B2